MLSRLTQKRFVSTKSGTLSAFTRLNPSRLIHSSLAMAPHSLPPSSSPPLTPYNGSHRQEHHTLTTPDDQVFQTQYLIVGCGPAGASLACFLSSHGTKSE